MSNTIKGAFCWNWANHSRKLCHGMKAMNHILILSRSEEGTLKSNSRNTIQGDSAHTERIKYNTNGIKTRSSKNIDLLKVKRRHSWIQWSNKFQQHFCWSWVNNCYKCTKRKIIAWEIKSDISKCWKICV